MADQASGTEDIFLDVPPAHSLSCIVRTTRVILDILQWGLVMCAPPLLIGVFLVLLGGRLDGKWDLTWSEIFAPVLLTVLIWVIGLIAAVFGHCARPPARVPLIERYGHIDPPDPVPAGLLPLVERQHRVETENDAETSALLHAAGRQWRRVSPNDMEFIVHQNIIQMFGRRVQDLRVLHDSPFQPICRYGRPGNPVALLAEGDDATCCGAFVRHCLFDRTRVGPAWLSVSLALAATASLLLFPIMIWMRLAHPDDVPSWGAAFAPLWIGLSLLTAALLPLSVLQCQWSRIRGLYGIAGASGVLCCLFIPAILLAVHGDDQSVPAGVVIIPWLIAEVCCCVPCLSLLVHLHRAAPPKDVARDPHDVQQDLNPVQLEEQRIRRQVQGSATRHSPLASNSPRPSGARPTQHSAVAAAAPAPSEPRSATAPASTADIHLRMDQRGNSERARVGRVEPLGTRSASVSDPEAALAPPRRPSSQANARASPWYHHRDVAGYPWTMWCALWLLITALLVIALELAWAIGDGEGFSGPGSGGSPSSASSSKRGVSYLSVLSPALALCVVWAVGAMGLTATLLRQREALGGVWSGFYSGQHRAIVMNNENSLRA